VVVVDDGDTAWLSAPDLGSWAVDELDELSAARHDEAAEGGTLTAPMPGTVTVVHVVEGEKVAAGQALLVVEAMKMEHPITAPVDGVVSAVHVTAGQAVAMDAALAVVLAAEGEQ
jgi:acetyl-CoA/propionyl-CoA carboxylase biotin carboxyl carrier protein